MTATLPSHFSTGTPTPGSPYPGSFGPGGPAQPSLSGYDEFLPTGRTPLGDYLTFFWLPRRLPGWAEGTRRYRTWTVNTLLDSPPPGAPGHRGPGRAGDRALLRAAGDHPVGDHG